jgi:hypothetical protein
MKCFKHKNDAVAICAHCGRGICEPCATSTGLRLTCSPDCAAALVKNERAVEALLHKSVQSLKASAFYCYLCGALSAAAAIVAQNMLPSPFLILFTSACAVVLIASGIWYTLAARKQA